MFDDCSCVFSSLAEYHSQLLQAEENFSNLPSEIRPVCNTSASQYFISYGSDKFSSIFSRNIPAKPESGDSVIATGIN